MSNETITDKKLFICCSQNKRQYYKAKIRNFYLQGILLSDDIYDADIVLHIQDGRPDQHVCQEITIASERKLHSYCRSKYDESASYESFT